MFLSRSAPKRHVNLVKGILSCPSNRLTQPCHLGRAKRCYAMKQGTWLHCHCEHSREWGEEVGTCSNGTRCLLHWKKSFCSHTHARARVKGVGEGDSCNGARHLPCCPPLRGLAPKQTFWQGRVSFKSSCAWSFHPRPLFPPQNQSCNCIASAIWFQAQATWEIHPSLIMHLFQIVSPLGSEMLR